MITLNIYNITLNARLNKWDFSKRVYVIFK